MKFKLFSFALMALCVFLSFQRTAEAGESKYLTKENFRQVQLTDFSVNYLHKGQGEPVLLLHGGGEWSYTFRQNIDALSQKYSVYALDLPGHGYTVPRNFAASDLGFPAIRRVVSEFMDSQGISQATLIGHSWGGGFAIDYALSNPQRVKSLVLLDSSGIDVPDHWEWEVLKFKFIGRLAAGVVSRTSTLYSLRNAFYHYGMVTKEMLDEVYAPLQNDFNKRSLYYLSRNLKWKPVEDSLSLVSQPTLVIWGEKDEFIPLQVGKVLSERIANSTFFMVEKAGHNVHEEKPEIVNQKIIEFLDSKSQ
jgi:pimeloyl-ACP methyl ester carboxylesterase